MPLRFAAIGAAPSVAFTVFVAARTPVAPSAPFSAATINDLDGQLIGEQGYARALENLEDRHHQRVVVLEGEASRAWLQAWSGVGPTLLGWLDEDAKLTRLSARFRSASMTDDVTLATPYDAPRHGDSGPTLAVLGADALTLAAHELTFVLAVTAEVRSLGEACAIESEDGVGSAALTFWAGVVAQGGRFAGWAHQLCPAELGISAVLELAQVDRSAALGQRVTHAGNPRRLVDGLLAEENLQGYALIVARRAIDGAAVNACVHDSVEDTLVRYARELAVIPAAQP